MTGKDVFINLQNGKRIYGIFLSAYIMEYEWWHARSYIDIYRDSKSDMISCF